MASSLPLDFGGYQFGIRDRPTTLSEVVQSAGYSTGAVVTAEGLGTIFSFDRGFDSYVSLMDFSFTTIAFYKYCIKYIRTHCALKNISVEYAVKILTPNLTKLLDAMLVFCSEKENEKQTHSVILTDFVHRWDFTALKISVQAMREKFRRDPVAVAHEVLLLRHGQRIFDFIPDIPLGRHGFSELTLKVDEKTFRECKHGPARASAAYTLANLRRWIDYHHEKPFFAWAHLMDVHDICFSSFDITNAAQAMAEEETLLSEHCRKIAAANSHKGSVEYDLAVRYVDRQLEIFVADLKERSLLNDTLLVIVSDHGHLGPTYPFRQGVDVMDFYDELYHVPVCFVHPDLEAQCLSGLYSGLDVPATLLDILRLPIPDSFKGFPALQNLSGRDHVLMEHLGRGPCDFLLKPINVCVRSKTRKVVYRQPPPGDCKEGVVSEVYDLISDPQELRNVAHESPANPETQRLASIAAQRVCDIWRDNDLQERAQNAKLSASFSSLQKSPDALSFEVELLRSYQAELIDKIANLKQENTSLLEVCRERMNVIETLDHELQRRKAPTPFAKSFREMLSKLKSCR